MSDITSTSFYGESEDILVERRNGSDLHWSARELEESEFYKYRKKLDKKTTFQLISKSERVEHAINMLVMKGQSKKSLEDNVNSILEDMCHTLDVGMIRKFAFILPKIMKRIYGKIFVNKAGIEMIKASTSETPVVFLPTHRSYADFLLISYIAFHYSIPFPVIAAGMDFMSMVVIGDMLRGSGAFYIKRSFMDDPLYWAVFQEYVQLMICDSGQPMEFFLEGTRSRSGKSLRPKLGLLGCIVECWLRGKVQDITIVPISISYNRTLEETLYAYEMLGVPKPVESTSGLLKAMKILREKFGNIYVHIGRSISVSDFLGPKVDRHLFNSPIHLSSLNFREFKACETLALRVVRCLQTNCVVSIWSVACVSLLRCLWAGLWSLPFPLLLQETLVVAHLTKSFGAVVEGTESRDSVEAHLRRSLSDHCDTAVLLPNGNVHIQAIHKEDPKTKSKVKVSSLSGETIESSVTHLLLQYYVNQLLHFLIRPALAAMTLVRAREPLSKDKLFQKYEFLTSVFSFDFIFEKEATNQDFEDSLDFLVKEGCLDIREGSFVARPKKKGGYYLSEGESLLEFLLSLLQPFLLTYQVALQVVESQPVWGNEGIIVTAVQMGVESSASVNLLYSALSLDVCRQAVKMLIKMEALVKTACSNGDVQYSPNSKNLILLKEILQPSLAIPTSLLHKL